MKTIFKSVAVFMLLTTVVAAEPQIKVAVRMGTWGGEDAVVVAVHPEESVFAFGGPNGQLDVYRPNLNKTLLGTTTIVRIQNKEWGAVTQVAMDGNRIMAVNDEGSVRIWELESLTKSNGILSAPSFEPTTSIRRASWLRMRPKHCLYLQAGMLRRASLSDSQIVLTSATTEVLPLNVPEIQFFGQRFGLAGSYFFQRGDLLVCDEKGNNLSEINFPRTYVRGVDVRDKDRLIVEDSEVHWFRDGQWPLRVERQGIASANLVSEGMLVLSKDAGLVLHNGLHEVSYDTTSELRAAEEKKPPQMAKLQIPALIAQRMVVSSDGQFFAVGCKGRELLIGAIISEQPK